MSILSENLMDGTWEEELALLISLLPKTNNQNAHDTIKKILDEHLKRNDRRLCWNKYRYIAITPPTDRPLAYAGTKLIIAGELNTPNDKCEYWRWIGNVGKKTNRGVWSRDWRSQDNPILSTGWKFSNYKIYIIPDDLWGILKSYLPKSPDF